ncbi:uncharacterized protein BP01DRAFT_232642 [Aspergillus saccharolyticus JOP 1030-1]|uniref:Uncharacterized protein n=1 Tax=Aspergillus saccharolyticus JOP 1030-1 TaxID=1450539 RepID=A0A318YYQ2_9EURO|nr:hypothetical protein BP01DRAFT_232642 [Aspergillus saccharolyticus JOP 1030-1]PYH40131.1 hypothetical protein BP01DRAFT_232642 [Aspergillus saccharolyticus JOP 1030-1]
MLVRQSQSQSQSQSADQRHKVETSMRVDFNAAAAQREGGRNCQTWVALRFHPAFYPLLSLSTCNSIDSMHMNGLTYRVDIHTPTTKMTSPSYLVLSVRRVNFSCQLLSFILSFFLPSFLSFFSFFFLFFFPPFSRLCSFCFLDTSISTLLHVEWIFGPLLHGSHSETNHRPTRACL